MDYEKAVAKLKITRRTTIKKVEQDHDLYEGDLEMDAATKKAVEELVGNGAAKVTVSREVSESDFGTGARVFVSVTLTCHQSVDHINYASDIANQLATDRAWSYHEEARKQLEARGLVKPRQ